MAQNVPGKKLGTKCSGAEMSRYRTLLVSKRQIYTDSMKSKDKKSISNDIREKTNRCLENRKHANDIIDIISKLQVNHDFFTISRRVFC